MERIHVDAPMNVSQAMHEAYRCLQCFDPPCTKACPAGIVIPRFIRMLKSGNLRGAAEVVRSSNPMASSCGLACPDEQLCASACLRSSIDRPIAIRNLHRFVTDAEEAMGGRTVRTCPGKPGRVAIVGAGPGGLACAYELRRLGIDVVLLEAQERGGGVLASTIPLYRFPAHAIDRDIEFALGRETIPHKPGGVRRGDRCERGEPGDRCDGGAIRLRLGENVEEVDKLAEEYDAVFLAPGLVSANPFFPGDDLKGVTSAVDFLNECRRKRYANRGGADVIVLGGGNVAVDAAMAAIRCAEVSGEAPPRVQVLYRRTRDLMPAWEREVREAEDAGVVFHFLVAPLEFVGQKGRLVGMRACRTQLGPEDSSGRRSAVPVPGTTFSISCDQAILAMGTRLDRRPLGTLPVTRSGFLKVDRGTGRVRGNVFAGGDAIGGGQSIAAAVGDAKKAARAIAAFLRARRGGNE